MTDRTKGEWIHVGGGAVAAKNVPQEYRAEGHAISTTGRAICQCTIEPPNEAAAEDIANANLIAAAPDMFEALREILDEVRWAQPSSIAGGGGPWKFSEHPCFKRAYDAMEKARGEI